MDEQNVNQQIQAGLALFADKQRELEALAAHVEQEKAQLLALKQQTPMSYPMVNPYLGLGAQQPAAYVPQPAPVQQPVAEQMVPVEAQPAPVHPQMPQQQPQPPATTSGTATSSLEADVRMLARGLDQHSEKFNAALESVMSTLNDITRRLVLLEGGQSSSPTFDEVFEPVQATEPPVSEVAPVIISDPVPPPAVDTVALAERVDLLSVHVHKLTKLVDAVLEQQRRTNEYQKDLLDFLGAQFGYDSTKNAKPAVVLETPYVASTTADVVDTAPAVTSTASKKSKKHKRKKKKR